MNLATEAWIPVVSTGGQFKTVSLQELFEQSEQIRDLAVRPPERVALMRLFICIVQAALDGPVERDGIPAQPVCRGMFATRAEAARNLIGNEPIDRFTRLEEVSHLDAGTDSYNDQPESFGTPDASSGGRVYSVRRVNLIVGKVRG